MNKAKTYNKTTLQEYNLNFEEFDNTTNTFRNTLANNTQNIIGSNNFYYGYYYYQSVPPSAGAFVYKARKNPLPAVPSDYQFYFYEAEASYVGTPKSFRWISFAGYWWGVTLDFAFPTPKTLRQTWLDGKENSGNTYYIVNGNVVIVDGLAVLNFTGYTNYLNWQYMVYDSTLGTYKNSYAGVSGAKWVPTAFLQPSFDVNYAREYSKTISQGYRNANLAINELAYYLKYKEIEIDNLTTLNFGSTSTSYFAKVLDAELIPIDEFNEENLLGVVTNSVFNVAEQCIDLPLNIAEQLEEGEFFDLIPDGLYKKNTIDKPISVLPKYTSLYGGNAAAGDPYGDQDLPYQFFNGWISTFPESIQVSTLGVGIELQESSTRIFKRFGYVNWLPPGLKPNRISQTKFGARNYRQQHIKFDMYRYTNTPKTYFPPPADGYNSSDEYNYKYDQKFYDNPIELAEIPWLASSGSNITFNVYRRNNLTKWKTGEAVQIVPAKAINSKEMTASQYYAGIYNSDFNGNKNYNYFSWLDARYVNLNANTITMQENGYLENWQTGKKVTVYKSSNIYPGAAYAVVNYIFKTNQAIIPDVYLIGNFRGDIFKNAGLDQTQYKSFYLSNQNNSAENGFYTLSYYPSSYGTFTGSLPYEKYYKQDVSQRSMVEYTYGTFSYGSFAANPKMPPYFTALGDSIEAWKKDLYICVVNDFSEDNNGKVTVYKKAQPWKLLTNYTLTAGAGEKIELTNYQKNLLVSHYSRAGYGETSYISSNYYGNWFCGTNVLASIFSYLPEGLENGGTYYLIKNGAEVSFALTYEDALEENKIDLLTIGQGAICVYNDQTIDTTNLKRFDMVEGEEVESILDNKKEYYLINTLHGFQLADTKEDAEDGIAIEIAVEQGTYLKLQKTTQKNFSKQYFWDSNETNNLEVFNDKRNQVVPASDTTGTAWIGPSNYYNSVAPMAVEDIKDGVKVNFTISNNLIVTQAYAASIVSKISFDMYSQTGGYYYGTFRYRPYHTTDPLVTATMTQSGGTILNANATSIIGYSGYYGFFGFNSFNIYNVHTKEIDPTRPAQYVNGVYTTYYRVITNPNYSYYPKLLPVINYNETIIDGYSIKYTIQDVGYWKYVSDPQYIYEGQFYNDHYEYIPATYSQKKNEIIALANYVVTQTIAALNTIGDVEFILGYPSSTIVKDFYTAYGNVYQNPYAQFSLFAKLFDYLTFENAEIINKSPLKNNYNIYWGAKKVIKRFKQITKTPYRLVLDSNVIGIGPVIANPFYTQALPADKHLYPPSIYSNLWTSYESNLITEDYQINESVVAYGLFVIGCYVENKTDTDESFFQLNIYESIKDKDVEPRCPIVSEVQTVYGGINQKRIYKKDGNQFVAIDNEQLLLPVSLSISDVDNIIDTSKAFTLQFTQPEQTWRKQSFTKQATNDIGGVDYYASQNWNRISEHIDDEMITTAGAFPTSIVASYKSNKKVWSSQQLDSNGVKFKIEVVPKFFTSFDGLLYYQNNQGVMNSSPNSQFYMNKGSLQYLIYASPNKSFTVNVYRDLETEFVIGSEIGWRPTNYFVNGVNITNSLGYYYDPYNGYYYGYYYGYYGYYGNSYYNNDNATWGYGPETKEKSLYTRKTLFYKKKIPSYLTDVPNVQTLYFEPIDTIRDRITNNNGLELAIVEQQLFTAPQVKDDSYYIFYGVITNKYYGYNYYLDMPYPSVKIGTGLEQTYSSNYSSLFELYWKYKPTFEIVTSKGIGAEVEVTYKSFTYYPKSGATIGNVFTKSQYADFYGAGFIGYECWKIDTIKVIKGGRYYAPKNTGVNSNNYMGISLLDHYKFTGEQINTQSRTIASPQTIYRRTFEIISSFNFNSTNWTGYSGFNPVYGKTYSDAELLAMSKLNPRGLTVFNFTKPKKGLDGMAEMPNPNSPVTISYLTKLELK